ncbi:hypothetical protein HNQ43_001652 [Faecalicoccus acidiformans]|uniref:DUF1307 domain-containing protein n=1 Tax=Faecalicoccus acidiformans TaxID=915173 RepID=A0A7W8D1L7_9FIRM|nr:hypothetical protein [Faecalicoccus acidiformans]MBB5185580.1 hypothetical protein [Faecalicoccus acidiformans]
MKKMKRLFSLILASTMGMGLVGCSSSANEEETTKKTETVEKEETIALPTETMSPEETLQLTAGTEIKLEDLEKMPDEATLEENNLMTTYNIVNSFLDENGEKGKEIEMQEGLGVCEYDEHGYREQVGSDGKTQEIQITGITIEEITNLVHNNDGTITKCFVDDYDQEVRGGNIISEKLLAELN